MYALILPSLNGPRSLTWRSVPDPEPVVGEVVIEVAAAGVNRVDLSQTHGRYTPSSAQHGLSIPGVECSGRIVAVGPEHPEDSPWQVGAECCTIVNTGAYAQRVVAPLDLLMPIPSQVSLQDAAALPIASCVAWSTLVIEGRLQPGDTALIWGATGGMGSTAVLLAKALGARVVAMAGSDEGVDLCYALGADIALNYREEDPRTALTPFGGANVILDVQGPSELGRNIDCLAPWGRIVTISTQGGAETTLNYRALMAKKGSIITASLRSRPEDSAAVTSRPAVVRQVVRHMWPLYSTGVIRPAITRRIPVRSAYDVLLDMEKHTTQGKTILRVS